MAIQGTPELRKKLKRFYREYWRVAAESRVIEKKYNSEPPLHMKNGKLVLRRQPVLPKSPEFPEECRGMTCAAMTRKGTPCKQTALYGECGRCKFHGGMSTGPRTKKGKKQSAKNGLKPKRRDRDKEQARLSPSSPQQSEPHEMGNIHPRFPQGSDRMTAEQRPCDR